MQTVTETIAAIATAPGKGGVGIVRISGSDAPAILMALTTQPDSRCLQPRQANFASFFDASSRYIDQGLTLYFPAPHSFTGETIVEIQAHGGPVILDMILERVIQLGARQARPGEFSERAFLNDKIDLAQAEAIADLIDSASREAALAASRSLNGEFSRDINALIESIIHLRMYVEAALDFPEEEVDFLADTQLMKQLEELQDQIRHTLVRSRNGAALQEGITVAIAGLPNAGKSSLLNCLARYEAAIVTDIPGTTRDIIRENIVIDGLPVRVVDTAGIREATDAVEAIGVERARKAIAMADLILFVEDASGDVELDAQNVALRASFPEEKLLRIRNKIDLIHQKQAEKGVICLSAQTGEGIDDLCAAIRQKAGIVNEGSSWYSARRRHVVALEQALAAVKHGIACLSASGAGELLAEDLRAAQSSLDEITGRFTADDLLGRIFSSFCIGK